MRKIGLSCFEGFVCKADKCKDNCCIGWEIDIDQVTLEKYKNYKGALSDRFEKDICYEDTPHFILGEGERCPFLNKDGLCDIILDSGEDMLCEICDKHPRFYEWLPGMTFEGYGIGCEKAAEMLISSDKPINFTETEIPATATMAKAFLWDAKTFKPMCESDIIEKAAATVITSTGND